MDEEEGEFNNQDEGGQAEGDGGQPHDGEGLPQGGAGPPAGGDPLEEQEEPYLCKLFGEGARFVKFVNLTGRPLRLTSRLQMTNYVNMTWSSRAIIHPFSEHMWRFLGESHNISLYFLSLLPDPYHIARRNSYSWQAEYIDTREKDQIHFDDQPGTLDLHSLPEITPGETKTVFIRRSQKEVSSLFHLVADRIVYNKKLSEDSLEQLRIPKTIGRLLLSIKTDYEEIWNNQMDPCQRCKEIHQ